MTRLHFHPIKGKALDIIDAILFTDEVVSVNQALGTIRLVVEELVGNIVNYSGSDYLDVEVNRDKERFTLRFRDKGIPFNPLEKDPPDTTLPMEQRKIGGLGIFLVKKKMDAVEYEYTNGENVLTASLNTLNI